MITVRKLVLTLVALLLAAAALAQDDAAPDDVLQRYSLATENLEVAVASLAEEPSAARSAIDQAFSALLTLSRGTNATLAESLDRVFARARTAIDNRSATDLAVQVEVLRGGFGRLLYESALTAAVEGRDDLARQRLLRLASDVGLGSARIDNLEATDEVGALRRTFEAGVAEQAAAELSALAQEGLGEDPDAAYRRFADAYGDYLLVQDSPRLTGETNRLFVEAANAIVDGDAAVFSGSLSDIATRLESLREAADAGAEDAVSDTTEVIQGDAAPADTGTDDAAGDGEAPAAPADEPAPAGDADAAVEPEEEPEATTLPLQEGEDGTGAAPADAPGEEGAVDEAAVRERVLAEQATERREALSAELGTFGVTEADREVLADTLLAADVERVDDAETRLAALADRLGAHVLRGESAAARARLDDLRRHYAATLEPLVDRVAPAAGASLAELLARLDEAPALRTADAALLSSELQALSEALRGAPASSAHEAVDTASSWWSGAIRPAVMIVLALLTLLPLRLLDLAFGGANRNWRLIGLALFLLLLPVMYEGVAAAAALLAAPVGLPALRELTAWSMFGNDLTQMVWAVLTLSALVLASIGFYGICVQFGVLGRGRAAAPSQAPASRDDTLVDWDDDF